MPVSSSARVSVSTIDKEIKKLTKPGDRHKRVMGLLDSWGAITYNQGGPSVNWRVEYKEATPEYADDMDSYSPPRRNRWREASVKWHHWREGESISEFEQLVQQDNKLALFNLVKAALDALSRDFNKHLCSEIFKDGDSTEEDHMDGLETMYSDISAASGVAGVPAGTYAGLSMVLNYYGAGKFDGTWPNGTGSLEYFFNSPIVADYTNSGWSATTKTWQYTWREAMDWAETHVESLHGIVPDVWVMTPEMLRLCRLSLHDKERIEISQIPELLKLGFRGLSHNGSELIADHYCTLTTLTDMIVLRTYCNMRFETPAFFPCLRSIS